MTRLPPAERLQSVPDGLDIELQERLARQRARTLRSLQELDEVTARLHDVRRVALDRYNTYEAMLREADGQLNLMALTWTCMVCGADRPDSAIAVAHRPIRGLEQSFPRTRTNVRHCADRPSCVKEANAEGPWPPLARVEDPT